MVPQTPTDTVFWLMAATMGLPLLAFFIIFFITRKNAPLSIGVSLLCSGTPLICAWSVLLGNWHITAPIIFQKWWLFGVQTKVSFGFFLDPLSMLMLTIVCTISFLVQLYSIGYMNGDEGISKFYSFLSLFAWSMITLVVAPGIMQLYIFWEMVGLSSYLLIGFWHHKFSASEAGKKAFVMTRFGDLGFFLGIIVLLLNFGDLSILGINADAAAKLSPAMLTTSALLIFCGVVGKSAQFPLLTWLPDAMEGPTPVSSLLHSATMVAAGVYLVSRIFPFYQGSPDAMAVVLAIGTITMLLSSTMAMVARDLKQVWAFSTVSQLGFMLMGLGAGSYFAGVFHLTTHAAFKCLLFLCSGVFIHHFGSNDMYEISKAGGRTLRIPMVAITIAGSALAGIFPFAGFFSKEAIMGALADLPNPIWVAAGMLGALMTAYYTFRLLFIMWCPRQVAEPHHQAEHGHDDHGHGEGHHSNALYYVMATPLVVLSIFSLFLGFGEHNLAHFILWGHVHEAAHHAWILPVALTMVFGGVGLAWYEFGRKAADQSGFLSKLPTLEALFANRWYMDNAYRYFLDYVIYGTFSRLFTLNDRRIVDGGIDGFCRGTVGAGRLLSFLQSGKLQYNLFTLVLVVAVLGLYFLLA